MGLPQNPKQAILEKIKSKLDAISSAGGEYYFTYSGIINLNKTSSFSAFGINIQDTLETLIGEDSSSTIQDNELEIIIALNYPDNASLINIYKNEADILKCIGNNLTWDGLTMPTDYVSSVRNKMDQLGQKLGDMVITIKMQFRKNSWNM